MTKQLVLVTGGARAGKSAFAESLAHAMGSSVLFVATATALDAEMGERIARHRASRPSGWETLEAPVDVTRALDAMGPTHDAIILDCLTVWLSNLLHEGHDELAALDSVGGLLDWYRRNRSSLIVVTNEVGLGIVPDRPSVRHYRDCLGRANQQVAAMADRVYLLVAGLPIEIKSLADPH